MGVSTNKVVIVSAPSGAGKTTLVHHLLNQFSELAFSVSACTRPRRDYEVDGKDYYFMSNEDFLQAIENGEFVEWEQVYPGKYYGTLKREVDRIWALGKSIVFDVDVIGALTLKEYFGQQALAVFVQPPGLDVLKERLKKRQTESDEALQERIEKARHELTQVEQCDVVVVNDDLAEAKKDIARKVNSFLKNSKLPEL